MPKTGGPRWVTCDMAIFRQLSRAGVGQKCARLDYSKIKAVHMIRKGKLDGWQEMIFFFRFSSSTAFSIWQPKNARQTLGDKLVCI